MKFKKSLISASVFFTCTSLVQAADTLKSHQELRKNQQHHTETIVVTGTRTPKLLSNSPVKVDVIDAIQMKVLTSSTVAKALNFIPGVVVTRNAKDGYNIQMQGFDGDNVLVLVDGQPLISPTGSAVDLDQISAHDIEQVEVIRGAASVMYGSAAMGGVINIITKQMDSDSFEPYSKIDLEVGRYLGNEIEKNKLAKQVRLTTNFELHNWINRASLLVKETPGFDLEPENVQQNAGQLDKTFFNFASNGKISGIKTSVKYQFFSEEKARATGSVPGSSPIQLLYYTSDVDQHQIDFSMGQDVFDKTSHRIADTSWQLNARMMRHDEISGSATKRDANIELYELNAQHVWKYSDLAFSFTNPLALFSQATNKDINLNGEAEIVAGGVLHQDKLSQVNLVSGKYEIEPSSRESIEGFLQANWINDEYQALVGIRTQLDSEFGFHSAVRASGMWDWSQDDNKLQWRFGLGQGYRVPNLKELKYEFDHSALGYMVLGNPDLKPENSWSANSTWDFQTEVNSGLLAGGQLKSELNLHYSKANNFIESFNDPILSSDQGLDISVYNNIDRATMQGVDTSFELRFDTWYSQVSYSYLDARDGNHTRLKHRPYHQVKANLGYSQINWDLDAVLYLVYQSNEHFDKTIFINGQETAVNQLDNEWLTVDFKLNQQINKFIGWRFGVENIFDTHQSPVEPTLFDARDNTSRYVYFGMDFTF
ncbi:TonB-dependent receptor plug domain-containing protein [Catenovulum maritimum]|uniref:TonB-dependent receptor plug domain-containing protein n=1 Tax=Catenovulum maritimum TaxID=1513271 RepID=UPI0006603487|nr:TonB-dependent receptor [Catenovulum maritimum]